MIENIGRVETESGTVFFQMNGEYFEARTNKQTFTIYDEDVEEIDGRFFYTFPGNRISAFWTARVIEIPAWILKRRDEFFEVAEKMKENLCRVKTPNGDVYFSVGGDGQIIAKRDEKTYETKNIYTVEGMRVVCFPDLGFVVVPDELEAALKKYEAKKRRKDFCLMYAGQSLLTGKHYFKFSHDITNDEYARVSGKLEYFEPGDFGDLAGWLTTDPEWVEDLLRIRRNRVVDRKDVIEKQKAAAVKENEHIVKKLIAS